MDQYQFIKNFEKYCSCGSRFPVVDLTDIFCDSDSSSIDTEQICSALIKAFQFGAFHITIDTEHLLETEHANLIRLADEKLIVEKLENIFDESFIKFCGNDENNDKLEVFCKVTNNDIVNMTYRGRHAESGSTKGDGEPKQSWECLFCNKDKAPTTGHDSLLLDDRLDILKTVTHTFHLIGEKIFGLLDLPDFISHGECTCKKDESNCSIDLMRAFRYDAVEPDKRFLHLGSSEHTDWGSLTIVWQDDVGGLQIYCHDHDTWNDVVPVSSERYKLRLFVHVGDFTSIAISDAVCTKPGGNHMILCPSPLHRVICPAKEKESNPVRHSLVFFAYPKLGFSLNDASEAIKNSKIYDDLRNHAAIEEESHVFYNRFMVLKNQSECSGNESLVNAKIVYDHIRQEPFHHVIRNKWNQVQRRYGEYNILRR